MIKQIQLRGISRAPSDRLTADGGCAESLNVHLKEGETAPTQAPQDVSSTYYSSSNTPDKLLFIHKGNGYEHMIGIKGRVVKYHASSSSVSTVLTISSPETFSDIKSIGNTLIVASSAKMYYALWTGTTYKYLGNRIPIPDVSFRIGNMTKMRTTAQVTWESAGQDGWPSEYLYSFFADNFHFSVPSIPHSTIGETHNYGSVATRYVFTTLDDEGFWNNYLNHLWEFLEKHVYEKQQSGKAVFPMFIRYAVRLYDGTLYAQSIPILVGGDISKFVDIRTDFTEWYTNDTNDTPKTCEAWTVWDIAEAYSVYLNRASASTIFDDWKDIVSGVDIFISPQIFPMLKNAAKFRTNFTNEYVDQDRENWMNRRFLFDNFSLDPYYTEDNQEELVKNYQTTFLAKSFTVDEFKALSGDVLLNDLNFSSDWIMTQEAMKETPGSMHVTTGKDLFSYNKRLMLGQASQELSHGYAFFPSSKWSTGGGNYLFVYYIRGTNGECIVRSRNSSGNESITARTQSSLVNGSSTTRTENISAWIAYPDSRCYLVEIYKTVSGTTTKASYAMKPCSEIDVSYAFIGFGVSPSFSSTSSTAPSEKLTYPYAESLLVSKFSNPFVFSTADAISFDGRVLSTAVITIPLSQGQVGDHALYVFTEEGIYAMSVTNDGSFSAKTPVSRDVLVSKNALVAIEQGIFFVTKKGVMLLVGMTVTDISTAMIGKHYVLDTSLSDKVQSSCSAAVADTTPFMSFIESSRIAFDYSGKRLIFFNNTKTYQYVYMMETKTWHKMVTASGDVSILNSYPECLVGIGGVTYDFSTVIDNASYLTDDDNTKIRQCVIITRPFDLGEPDVRKAIKSIRIRGNYLRNHVQYLLLGSFDGVHWKLLDSLRGGSYRMFRMFIRATLSPTERISWVDVDYEPRYTNKLR